MAVAVVLVTDDNGSGQVIGDSQITKKYFFKVQKCQIASKSVKQGHKYKKSFNKRRFYICASIHTVQEVQCLLHS